MKYGVMSIKRIILCGYGTKKTTQQRKVLAYVLGTRKDEVFLKLKALLSPFGIRRFYTDDWGASCSHLEAAKHEVGKRNTQKIENNHLKRKA